LEGLKRADRSCLLTPAVLHTDIAVGTHVKPGFKAVLEGHRRHVEVISQALQAEIALLFHEAIIRHLRRNQQEEISIDNYLLLKRIFAMSPSS
jgi:hypothetical protein